MKVRSKPRPKPLGEVVRFGNGKSIKPGTEGRYAVYGSNGIIGGSDEFRHENGVIIGRVGAYCGAVVYCPDRFWASDNTLVAYPANDQVDTRFLYYLLLEAKLGQHAGGAAQPLVTQTVLKQVEVDVPDLPTQRKIAGILSSYDDLIDNNLRRIKILEQMAQSLYREWFVHFRFPGHESATFKDSELGRIPDGWEVVTVNDMCDRVTDGSHSSPPSVEEGMPMVSSKDMHTFGLNLETSRTISHSEYEKLVRNGCKPRANDILITKDGANYLKYIFVVEKDLDVVLLSSIAMLTPNARINPHLFAAVLNSLENKERLKNFVTGAAIPRIILKDFKQFQFVLPPRELQTAWAKIGEFATRLCWDLIAKNKNLRRTRDLLLPKLLSPSN